MLKELWALAKTHILHEKTVEEEISTVQAHITSLNAHCQAWISYPVTHYDFMRFTLDDIALFNGISPSIWHEREDIAYDLTSQYYEAMKVTLAIKDIIDTLKQQRYSKKPQRHLNPPPAAVKWQMLSEILPEHILEKYNDRTVESVPENP